MKEEELPSLSPKARPLPLRGQGCYPRLLLFLSFAFHVMAPLPLGEVEPKQGREENAMRLRSKQSHSTLTYSDRRRSSA